MPHQVTLVIGASRGIGREFVSQLSRDPTHRVIAGVRKPVDFDSSNVVPILLDQSDPESVTRAGTQVSEIDTLIINAAIGADEYLLSTDDERLREYYDTNVIGPLRVVRAFLPALKARNTRQIVFISSESGSLSQQINAKGGFRGPYAVSKAAGNMIVVQLHNELHDQGFTVAAIHPGWVATDMGNATGPGGMPIPESVKGQLDVIVKLEHNASATFFAWDGSIVPW
ncbi:uncharacterized protein N7498_009855 [Penicillium cinerascens]|uniref:Uncharacterized protein n=1 Tax=Penicillium cinerascens TaxID=70096 RepID=A0A9W9M6B0_9EURO|nr:uncharacterized protein N7498_009855 [Penicillium cinerascens]KAJ5190870.1 hypothetical protein N7498_009855 [Penicillium cinerascens]